MNTRTALALVAILGFSGVLCMAGDAAPAPATTALGHPFLCADYGAGKVCKVDKDGKIEWKHNAPGAQDVWLLPSGNILLTYVKGVQEVSPEGKVVWEYKTDKDNEIHACQPLPDGVVMVAESGPCRLIEVDREGKILKEVKLTTAAKGTHGQMRGARKLASGNYIVGQYEDKVVREYDPTGKIVGEFKQSDAFTGIRLANGNTLIAAGDAHKVVEVDPKGEVVWELKENDLPGCPLRFVAGVQRLANGNTVICNWGGHGHVGKQPQIVEVSPDKKIVSQLFDNKQFQTISGVFVLDEKGDATKFELRR